MPVTLEVYIEEELEKHTSSVSSAIEHCDGKSNDTEYFKNEIMKILEDGQTGTIEVIDEIPNENDLFSDINKILTNILKESVASDDTINDNYNPDTDVEYFENEIIDLISIVCKEYEDKIENINNDSLLAVEDNKSAINLKGSGGPTTKVLTHDSSDNLKESVDPSAEVQLVPIHSSADNLKELLAPSAEVQLLPILSSTDNIKEPVEPSVEVQFPPTHNSPDSVKEFIDPSVEVQIPTTHSSADNIEGIVDTFSEDTDDRSKKVMFSVLDIGNFLFCMIIIQWRNHGFVVDEVDLSSCAF